MYGQLLMVVTERPTEPDVYCWVHYRTSLLTSVGREHGPRDGPRVMGMQRFFVRLFMLTVEIGPVSAAETVKPCVLVLLTMLQEIGPMLTAVWCCSQLVLIPMFPNRGMQLDATGNTAALGHPAIAHSDQSTKLFISLL